MMDVLSSIVVVVADGQQSSRDRLRLDLTCFPQATVAAEVREGSALLGILRRKNPDLLLIAPGFLNGAQARLIADRSYYTELPMAVTSRPEGLSWRELYPSGSRSLSRLARNSPGVAQNSLAILRSWSKVLEVPSDPSGDERVIITRHRKQLGLMFSEAVLSIRDSTPLPTVVTRWAEHEAVDGLGKIFSKDAPGDFFEACPGTWIALGRMDELQRKTSALQAARSLNLPDRQPRYLDPTGLISKCRHRFRD